MNYSIEQIKNSIITGMPLCAIAWGRETLRERTSAIAMPPGWGGRDCRHPWVWESGGVSPHPEVS